MPVLRKLSKEEIAAMRRDYAEGMPIEQILAKYKVSMRTLYHWVDGGPKSGPWHLPPLPRRGCGPPRRATVETPDTRRLLVNRLWSTASRQVREIEERLAMRGCAEGEASEGSDRERDARTLAVLVKTMRELAALDQAASAAQPPAPPQADTADDDDPVPRDIDEFRRELTRRINAFIADRRNGGGGLRGDHG